MGNYGLKNHLINGLQIDSIAEICFVEQEVDLKGVWLILFMSYLNAGYGFGSEKDFGDCFDKFLHKSGLERPVFSSPEMFEDVFSEEFYLGPMSEARAMFESYLNDPVSLEPVIAEVRHGVVNRQPAVGEFLCSVLEKDLIPDPDEAARNLILRALHNMLS